MFLTSYSMGAYLLDIGALEFEGHYLQEIESPGEASFPVPKAIEPYEEGIPSSPM
jgi:hypothetical protein